MPNPAQRDAEHKLTVHKRMREIEQSILMRAPEHDLEPSLDRVAAVMELLGDPQHASRPSTSQGPLKVLFK